MQAKCLAQFFIREETECLALSEGLAAPSLGLVRGTGRDPKFWFRLCVLRQLGLSSSFSQALTRLSQCVWLSLTEVYLILSLLTFIFGCLVDRQVGMDLRPGLGEGRGEYSAA